MKAQATADTKRAIFIITYKSSIYTKCKTHDKRAIYYILKDVKTKENKGDLFCSSVFMLYLCNTEINQQRTDANAGQT